MPQVTRFVCVDSFASDTSMAPPNNVDVTRLVISPSKLEIKRLCRPVSFEIRLPPRGRALTDGSETYVKPGGTGAKPIQSNQNAIALAAREPVGPPLLCGTNTACEDIVNVLAFLLGSEAAFISRASILADGGYTGVDYFMKKEDESLREPLAWS